MPNKVSLPSFFKRKGNHLLRLDYLVYLTLFLFWDILINKNLEWGPIAITINAFLLVKVLLCRGSGRGCGTCCSMLAEEFLQVEV